MKQDDTHLEAKTRFKTAEEFEREDRVLMEEDFCFAAGEQWPDSVESQRESDGRPCLTMNRLPQFISQVVGDARQNKPSIKIHPVDDFADQDTAEVIEGLVRHIESYSQASTAYLTAFEHAVTGGQGAWRISTKRDHKDPFVQDIHIERIVSPFAVYFDPNAKRYDKTDGNWCFVVEWITKEAFKDRYPKELDADWEHEFKRNDCSDWMEGDKVRLAEYWCKKPKIKHIALMADGRRVDWEELDPATYDQVQDVAETKSYEVVRYVMSGHKVLEGPEVFPGEFIPIVPVFGPEEFIGNRSRRRGLIRYAKDAQRQYNYWQTTITEKVALAPKAPYIGTVEQFKGLERFWNSANTDNRAFIPYNPDPSAPGAPQRNAPAAVNAAELQQAAQAVDDLKATTGIYDASLGNRSNENSGRAIIARQRQGDVSTYAWVDNLARSIELTGRIVIGLIPYVYDTQRAVRILGQDDSSQTVQINEPGLGQDGLPALLNDLTRGKYDVTVTVGPSYATKRMEAAESMMAFMQAFPQAAQVAGDLVAKAMDWPGADEIGDRLEKTLPPGMVEKDLTPEEEEVMRSQVEAQQAEEQMVKKLSFDKEKAETFSKMAKGIRDMTEAEAQEIENAATEAGIVDMLNG
jgi:hypothetical protein